MAKENIENLEDLSFDSLGDGEDFNILLESQKDDDGNEPPKPNEVIVDDVVETTDDINNNVDDSEGLEDHLKEIVVNKDTLETNTPSNDISENLSFFASALAEEGVLSSLDENTKIESFDDLAELVRKEIRANELSGLSDEQKEVLKRFELGLPIEDYVKTTVEINNLSSITKETLEKDADLRKQLITEDFASKGYSPEKASKLAQRSIDLGEDVEDSLEALETKKAFLAKQEATRIKEREQAIKDAQKNQKEMTSKIKGIVFDESKEIIPGYKYNPKIAEKTYKMLTEPVAHTDDGTPISAIQKKRAEDPVDFEIKLHTLFALTDGFSDFSSLLSGRKTKFVKEFEEKLGMNTFSKGGSLGDEGVSEADYRKKLKALEKAFE